MPTPLTHGRPSPWCHRTSSQIAASEQSTCGHRNIAALHHSVGTSVIGAHANTASRTTRDQRSPSSRDTISQTSTVAARSTSRIAVATTGQSYGAWCATNHRVSCWNGLT